MKDRPFFCTQPWTGLDVSPQGNIKPCCKFSTDISKNFAEYDAHELLQQVKQTFLDGGKPSQCQRCWQDEAAGLPSKRMIDQTHVIKPGTQLDHVKMIGLTFGNICNLACVTCNSSSSSRWLQDERKVIKQFKHLDKIHTHDMHYRDSNFIDDITARCKHLEYLTIGGGEPFLSDRNLHLDLLTRIPHPEKVKIHYVTNGTVFPDNEFWKVWRKFRHIDIQLSLDAIDKQFEYLRYPANWSEVLHNIEQYQQQKQIQISISHTVSWLNVLRLDDFAIWCMKQQLPMPYVGPVNHPNFLSVKSLPAEAKNYVNKCLCGGKWQGTKKILDLMFTDDQSKFFDQGIQWLRALDRIRNNNFQEVFPELISVIQSPIDGTD
jgi:MoaA/NifB/PqqE/SkfB family radical SAM enzyme